MNVGRYIIALAGLLLVSCRHSPIDGSWRMVYWTQREMTPIGDFVNRTNHLAEKVIMTVSKGRIRQPHASLISFDNSCSILRNTGTQIVLHVHGLIGSSHNQLWANETFLVTRVGDELTLVNAEPGSPNTERGPYYPAQNPRVLHYERVLD